MYFYITDTRASAHRWLIVPTLRLIYRDAEDAHLAGNTALKSLWHYGLYPRERGDPDRRGDLEVAVFGHTLRNPIGTSAGIDKHADIPDPLFAIGPSVIELGGATPMPQDGNDRPRVFRIPSQNALINRYGLNSEGADHLAMRLRQRVREYAYAQGFGYDEAAENFVLDGHAGVPPGSLISGRLMAVNIAKNKITPEKDVEAVKNDYVYCVERLAPYADILVVNVSSPNTPGLRTLQESGPLTAVLKAVVQAAKQTDRKSKPAVMVKVSPDEDSDEQITGICNAIWESGVDGVVVGNTTNRRPGPLPTAYSLTSKEEEILLEQGGYSGPHLFQRTVDLVKRYRKSLDGGPQRPPSETPPQTRQEESSDKTGDTVRAANASTESSETAGTTGEKLDDIKASVNSGAIPLKDLSDIDSTQKQPLLQLPDRKKEQLQSIKTSIQRLPPQEEREADQPKVIFATGGITNGKQALEVLNAGGSVAMVYTALVYGGAGTISRIKDEMRHEIKATQRKKTREGKKSVAVVDVDR